jgi:hypothetical protein
MRRPIRRTTILEFEQLEGRTLLSGGIANHHSHSLHPHKLSHPHPMLLAGDPIGSPTDSPAQRVDPNTPDSPFAGVGSLEVTKKHKSFLCTATALDATHVLTAAHCLDLNDDGDSNFRDKIWSVTFNINLDQDPGFDEVDIVVDASSWVLHPDYTGFNRPSVNDDLAIVTLATPLPPEVPTYALHLSPLVPEVSVLKMVGYGSSGDGDRGIYLHSDVTVKRTGENVADDFEEQDDFGSPDADEVFLFDFDGPVGDGRMGGPTLGNDRETTLGGGDSGGPSFVQVGSDPSLASSYEIAGVNTFTQGKKSRFYTEGGGMAVAAYSSWIVSALS